MTLLQWLKNWRLDSLKINAHFLEADLNFQDADRDAAWEMYIELLTRITTQPLIDNDGDEETAITSVYTLFGTTREIIRRNGPKCLAFTKIAVVILNQIIRPFTSRWHQVSQNNGFEEISNRKLFRKELIGLQTSLRHYAGLLSEIAGVEDLTDLEQSIP
jgi:hypothetical protein